VRYVGGKKGWRGIGEVPALPRSAARGREGV
jgi:hypothetical protein